MNIQIQRDEKEGYVADMANFKRNKFPGDVVKSLSKDKDGLTIKNRRFIREYLVDFNGAEAARRAGYAPTYAGIVAWQLLGRPAVKKQLLKVKNRLLEESEVSAKNVIKELARIAFSDVGDLVEWDTENISLIPKELLAEQHRRCIKSIASTQKGTKIVLHDKVKAIEVLMKYLGIEEGAGAPNNNHDDGFEKALDKAVERIANK